MNPIERLVAQEVHQRVFLYDLLHPFNLDTHERNHAFSEISLVIRQQFPEVAEDYDGNSISSLYFITNT